MLERAKRQIEELRPSESSSTKADEFLKADPRDPAASWQRLVLRAMWVLEAAKCATTIEGFATREADGSNRKKKTTGVMRMISWDQIVNRPMLTPSKSKIPYSATPMTCGHELLASRANQTANWFTCMTCGARWPRDVREMLDKKTLPGAAA